MNIKNQFMKTLKKYDMVSKGDKVIIGVSGGPDSICLLHLFNDFKDGLGIQICVAHLDHMFRGGESEKDADFVKALCHKLNIPFFQSKINVPDFAKKHGFSPEDAARRVRYNFFNEVKEKTNANKIATGHNRNDHEETILMNIFRGAGVDGLTGIEPVRDCYIRPLIEISRNVIDTYLKQENISFKIDKTNLTTDFFRNSLRLELIPLITNKYCPHLGKSLRRLSKIARCDLSFMNEETEKAFSRVTKYKSGNVIVDLMKFTKLHPAIKQRVIRLAVKKLVGNVKDFESKHTKLLVNFVEKAPVGKSIDLPKNIKVIKEYDSVILHRYNCDEIPDYNYILPVPGQITIKEIDISIKSYINHGNELDIMMENPMIVYLDYDKIKSDLTIRNRRPGDRFKPLGSDGSKKLKDFFIDEKIPRRRRNAVPIIEVSGKIVSVGNMRIDEDFKVTKETKRILVLDMKEN